MVKVKIKKFYVYVNIKSEHDHSWKRSSLFNILQKQISKNLEESEDIRLFFSIDYNQLNRYVKNHSIVNNDYLN